VFLKHKQEKVALCVHTRKVQKGAPSMYSSEAAVTSLVTVEPPCGRKTRRMSPRLELEPSDPVTLQEPVHEAPRLTQVLGLSRALVP
jgi:hypothetical protein